MKKILKFILVGILVIFARSVVRRYRPRIVMITGSVGKTSTKDAVAVVLSTKFFVRKSEKSFNSEFGVPFTILGVENPWNNPFAWVSLIKQSIALLVLPNHYPNMLVLEVGADRSGDLARILRIATPDAVVVTRLPDIPVHVESYTSPESVREEEFSPAYSLAASAPLIVPADDPHTLLMARRTPARVISYGIANTASVRISDVDFYENEGVVGGMHSHICIDDDCTDVVVKGSVGKTQTLPVAAAIALAKSFSISFKDACASLDAYEPPPGRGRLLAGKNESIIIDDSYNASPAAVEEALLTLQAFPHAKRRIAVLGDMLELGRYSVQEHRRIGTLACTTTDLVVMVGVRARAYATESADCELLSFENSRVAALALTNIVREGDVVLVKGSQSIRTERIVEALLADPLDAVRLVRQERKWKQKQ